MILDGGMKIVQKTSDSISPNDPIGCVTDSSLSVEPNDQEAEILLLEFKTNMTEQFPFVVIAPDSTSQSLQLEKPLLWKAIMVAASHEKFDRQLALGSKLMEDLTTRLLLRVERSLDLLQALLIFIAWYGFSTLSLPSRYYVGGMAGIDGNAGTIITPSSTHRSSIYFI